MALFFAAASAVASAEPEADVVPTAAERPVALALAAPARFVEPTWERIAERTDDDFTWTLFEEAVATPGRPAFRVEARLDVPPPVAAETLMDSLADPTPTTSGETRRLMERTDRTALVHTYIDLPFMFSDRELAIRIFHTREASTGVHRVDWVDANEVLPPPTDDVLRLATAGFWEFQPGESGGTRAVYVTRAEVGGSLPKALGDRLMRGQAEDAVQRLRRLVAQRREASRIDVGAAGPLAD